MHGQKNIKLSILIHKIVHQSDHYTTLTFSYLRSTNKMQRYTIFVYCCQCSTCFERFFRSSSGAQKLYVQHRVLVICVCCDKYPMLNVQFLST